MRNLATLAQAIGDQYPGDKHRAALCISSLGKDRYVKWSVSIVRYTEGLLGQVVCEEESTNLGNALRRLAVAWMPGRVDLEKLFSCA